MIMSDELIWESNFSKRKGKEGILMLKQKTKFLSALALSAVMAASLLTGCGFY